MDTVEVPTYNRNEAPPFPWQKYIAILDYRVRPDETRTLVAYKVCNDPTCKCKIKCRWGIYERDTA